MGRVPDPGAGQPPARPSVAEACRLAVECGRLRDADAEQRLEAAAATEAAVNYDAGSASFQCISRSTTKLVNG